MSDAPRIEITGGAPAPDEEAAVREAILTIWRDDVAAARRGAGESGWLVAARAAGARTRVHETASAHAWTLSLRFDAGPVSVRRTGRGDSK
ncbi:MAG TPA: hypothetical protein VM841_12615 [Actinomycetota bacterium]|nr:hypothetical protein [Actinomycetota bacterium]